jgi:hypothetical protein
MFQIQLNVPVKSVKKFLGCAFRVTRTQAFYPHLAGLLENFRTVGGAGRNGPFGGPSSTPGAKSYQVVESAV